MEDKVLKSGTTTVGILCKDGVVLAAEKRATSANYIVDKKAKKIHKITKTMALTTAGTVSDIQLLIKFLKAEVQLKALRSGREPNVKESANLLAGMVYQNIRKLSLIPGLSHFLFGGYDAEGFHLFDLFADGSLTKIDEFVATGSGSVFALGVLETLYNKDMKLDEAIKLAVKSINAAIQRDSASGEGIDVVQITKDGVKEVFSKELKEKLEV